MSLVHVAKGFGWMLVGFAVGGLAGALLGYMVASTVLCERNVSCDWYKFLSALGGATVISLMAGVVCGIVGGVASVIASSPRNSARTQ